MGEKSFPGNRLSYRKDSPWGLVDKKNFGIPKEYKAHAKALSDFPTKDFLVFP